MYCAVLLPEPDRGLHRFVWQSSRDEPLRDYCMTRVTFSVSLSSFTANMKCETDAMEHAGEFPLAVKAVEESFYVDDDLAGADTIEGAIRLQ